MPGEEKLGTRWAGPRMTASVARRSPGSVPRTWPPVKFQLLDSRPSAKERGGREEGVWSRSDILEKWQPCPAEPPLLGPLDLATS